MFHLTTHAFFKALLFLGAGSVIIALHHEQDIWKMGGLRKKMPVTFWMFLIGTLALCGVPPFSGFYSKDGILALALERENYPLFVLGVAVAGLTTFYMFRLFYIAFLGKAKTEAAGHAHESPPVMAWPLRVLGVFALVGGVIGVSQTYASQFGGTAGHFSLAQSFIEPFAQSPGVATIGIAAVAIGFFAARALYRNAINDPLPAKLGGMATAMKNRFYFDELYEATVIRAHDFIAAVMDWIDRWLLEWRLLHRFCSRRHGYYWPRIAACSNRQFRPTPSCSCWVWRCCCISCLENENQIPTQRRKGAKMS